LPPAEQTNIRFASGDVGTHSYFIQLALDAGLFKKYGLTGQSFTFTSSTAVVQALIAGQLDAAVSTSTQTISTLKTSRPAVDIGVFSTKLPDYLYAGKGLTAPDLKGKKAGVSTLGSQAYQEIIAGMAVLGMKPGDMTIVPIGGQAARIAALESGNVALVAADPALATQLAGDGILPVVKLPELANVDFAGQNVMVIRSFAEANPGTMLRLTAAILEAVQLPFTNLPLVVQKYAKYAQLSEADSQATWDLYLKAGIQRTLYASDASYAAARDALAPINPDAANFDLTKAHDFSFLDKLKAMGLDAQLGIPNN
jgi:ABC-type nitrate/sulfonate/bicarbonate transport system substrate-binding protein